MEAIVMRIGAWFMITTCLRAFPVQGGAQNGDTFDLTWSRKRRHGQRCWGKHEAGSEELTTANQACSVEYSEGHTLLRPVLRPVLRRWRPVAW